MKSPVKAPRRRLARVGEDFLGAVVFLCFGMPVDGFPPNYQYGRLREEGLGRYVLQDSARPHV